MPTLDILPLKRRRLSAQPANARCCCRNIGYIQRAAPGQAGKPPLASGKSLAPVGAFIKDVS